MENIISDLAPIEAEIFFCCFEKAFPETSGTLGDKTKKIEAESGTNGYKKQPMSATNKKLLPSS